MITAKKNTHSMYALRQGSWEGIKTWRNSVESQRRSEDVLKGMFVAQADPATVVKDQQAKKE